MTFDEDVKRQPLRQNRFKHCVWRNPAVSCDTTEKRPHIDSIDQARSRLSSGLSQAHQIAKHGTKPMTRTDSKTRYLLGISRGNAAPLGFARLATALLFVSTVVTAAPILQPGPPGSPSIELSPDAAALVSQAGFSIEDIRFVQDMIVHHQQAIDMAQLVSERTNQQAFLDVAGRIEASQKDEIEFMQSFLSERGQPLAAAPHAQSHDQMAHHKSMGMASPEQMATLASASSTDFETQFLTLMIAHHEGALKMVKTLLKLSGSAFDPILYQFITDLKNEQQTEIDRMDILLAGLSTDPRAGLAAGFRDAAEAAHNMTLRASLPKPPGFFDPNNPSGLPPLRAKNSDNAASDTSWVAQTTHWFEQLVSPEGNLEHGIGSEEKPSERSKRSPLLSFSYTDMAFSGDLLAVGSYHGINLYKIGASETPVHISSIVCPGGQGDVSIVGDLLLMSVEDNRGRVDCGLGGISDDISTERFRGLRIFDISNLERPIQVGQVQTCRGSHTHSVVASDDERIIVYNSGTSNIRKEEELAGCIGNIAGDTRTALFRIDVIEIPVKTPGKARITDSPTVFEDLKTGQMAGLWRGGKHDETSQKTSQTNQCHDITVYPQTNLAAGACSGNGIIFDISDPLKPQRLDAVTDTGFAYWHSATFNNDGTKVLFTDEWGGGGRPRCRTFDPMNWGANAIFDIVDQKLVFQSYYKLPAPQTKEENCVAHNGAIVPIPGRDIFVQAWYQGGISVIDFTNSKAPIEIGYFDRGPIHPTHLVTGGYWSSYWYQGRIYATEIVRGLDVLTLTPSEHLSTNEIAAAALANQGATFNPQQQQPVTWPADPVVARAYLDQLTRSSGTPADLAVQVEAFLSILQNPAMSAIDLSSALAGLTSTLDTMDHRSAKGLSGLLRQLIIQHQTTLAGVSDDSRASPLASALD